MPDAYTRDVTGPLPAVTSTDIPAVQEGSVLAIAAQSAVDQHYREWRVLREQARTYLIYVATVTLFCIAVVVALVGIEIVTHWH